MTTRLASAFCHGGILSGYGFEQISQGALVRERMP